MQKLAEEFVYKSDKKNMYVMFNQQPIDLLLLFDKIHINCTSMYIYVFFLTVYIFYRLTTNISKSDNYFKTIWA